jgi:hypothetical protein
MAVNVVDKEGNEVADLAAANFRGKFRGQAVEVHSAERDAEPRRVVVVLGAGSSMKRVPGKWDFARMATLGLVAHAPENVRLALLTYGGQLAARVDFGEGSEAMAAALASLADEPGSPAHNGPAPNLPEALQAAREMLEPSRTGDVIYLVSDVLLARSRETQEFEAKLRGDGVRLFVFRVFERRMVNFANDEIARLVEATGGNGARAVLGERFRDRAVYLKPDIRGVPASVVKLYQQMGEFYRVEVELPEALKSAQEWVLEAVGDDGKRMKDVSVVYPRRVGPCEAATGD